MLQQQSLDIVQGIELVQEVQEQLKELREEIDDWHKIWFKLAVDMAENVGTERPSIPRRCNRQTQRANVEGEVPEVFVLSKVIDNPLPGSCTFYIIHHYGKQGIIITLPVFTAQNTALRL